MMPNPYQFEITASYLAGERMREAERRRLLHAARRARSQMATQENDSRFAFATGAAAILVRWATRPFGAGVRKYRNSAADSGLAA